MTGQNNLKTKVCGMTRPEDVVLCEALGVNLVGFIFHPKSPRSVTPQAVACIETKKSLRVGVFVDQTPAEVMEIMALARLNLAQLHGDQDQAFMNQIGPQRVIRVLWPMRYAHVDELARDMERLAPHCAYFLLDAGTKGGGHGKSLEFSWLNGLTSPRPWLLAGGLHPENIVQALRACRPHGLDLNSGVETSPGIKDHEKLKRTLAIIHKEAASS